LGEIKVDKMLWLSLGLLCRFKQVRCFWDFVGLGFWKVIELRAGLKLGRLLEQYRHYTAYNVFASQDAQTQS